MLPRQHRLSRKDDFKRVFSRGLKASTPLYAVRWSKNTVDNPRFGFVVANTISKKATKRNIMRRRLREAVRRNLPTSFPAVDVVIIARTTLLATPYHDLEPAIIGTLAVIKKRTSSFRLHQQKK